MVNEVVIQSLEYQPLLEVRQLAPEILVGYLLSFNAREPSKLSVDFLSVEKSRLNRGFLAQAHQKGLQVYAWTVNSENDLEQQLDLGVDGVITDQSATARRIVDEYLQRPKLERAVRQVQTWLAE
jgi:glycerophosphoryl diester phosphodiesterase